MDVRGLPEEPVDRKQSLALGTFDGLHTGHRAILETALESARESDRCAGVLTFEPDPVMVFGNVASTERRLLTRKDKLAILEGLGFDKVYEVNFDRNFASTPPEAFVRTVLLDRLNAGSVHVGFNFRFGSKRKGDTSLLRDLLEEDGASLTVQEPVELDGKTVSSSTIRERVRRGDVRSARQFLGRPYLVYETLRRGDGRGRKIGFPTFNFPLRRTLHPRPGVYAVWLETGGLYPAVANFGRHPTVGALEEPLLEVHVLGSPPELEPGDEAHVHLGARIRDETEFDSVDELKERIAKDVERAEQLHEELDDPDPIESVGSTTSTDIPTEV